MKRFKLINGKGWEGHGLVEGDIYDEYLEIGETKLGIVATGFWRKDWQEVLPESPTGIYTVIPFFEGTNDIDFVRVRSFKDSQQANQYSDSLTSIEYSYVIASELL